MISAASCMLVTKVAEITETPAACSIAAARALCSAISCDCSALMPTMAQEPSAEMSRKVSAGKAWPV